MADSTVSFDIHTQNKAIVAKLCAAQADFTEAGVRKALCKLILPEAKIHMPHPFGDLIGPDEFLRHVLPLYLMQCQILSDEIGL